MKDNSNAIIGQIIDKVDNKNRVNMNGENVYNGNNNGNKGIVENISNKNP